MSPNEITLGVSLDKEEVQGLNTIVLRGLGDEEEAAMKMGEGMVREVRRKPEEWVLLEAK